LAKPERSSWNLSPDVKPKSYVPMKMKWFSADVYNILHIHKKDGKKMAYLYIKKHAVRNEMDAELESEQKFKVTVQPDKMPLLNNVNVGDNISILIYLNSKSVEDKNGNEHILHSTQLCALKKIEP
jgi:hypothetical protein